ncbi:hypothetical protein VB854_11890, partial [Limnoraphis robusta CCNP1315]|nr:hypothetical protein [Limnoraphis robusta CCNP1315]
YVKEAIAYNREKNIPGEVFFFYEGLDGKNGFLGDSLAANEYKEKAALPYRNKQFRPTPLYASVTETSKKTSTTVRFDIKKPGVYDFYSKVQGTAAVIWEQNPDSSSTEIMRKSKSDFTKAKMNGWFWMGQYEIKSIVKIGFNLNAIADTEEGESSSEVLILYNHLDSKK